LFALITKHGFSSLGILVYLAVANKIKFEFH
jgi:hypothetical protein